MTGRRARRDKKEAAPPVQSPDRDMMIDQTRWPVVRGGSELCQQLAG